jgi:hypothetical protein
MKKSAWKEKCTSAAKAAHQQIAYGTAEAVPLTKLDFQRLGEWKG